MRKEKIFKFPLQKGFTIIQMVVAIVLILVVIMVGITLSKNRQTETTIKEQQTSLIEQGTLKDLSNRSINQFFPRFIDNYPVNALFTKELTKGPEYKIIPLDLIAIPSKDSKYKAVVREAYETYYENADGKVSNILSVIKLNSQEDVENLWKIREEAFNTLPSQYIKTKFNTKDDGISNWIISTSDTAIPDVVAILFSEAKIFMQLQLVGSSRGQAAEQAERYMAFLKTNDPDSYVENQYLLTDKVEAKRLQGEISKTVNEIRQYLKQKQSK